MKTLLIFLILVAISSNATAEWVEIAEEPSVTEGDHGTIVYVDPTTIRKSGTQVVKMWFLFDHKKPTKFPPNPVWSEKSLYKFDCKEGKLQALLTVLFAEKMGTGRTTIKLKKSKWTPVAPDSVGKIMWDYACEVTREKELHSWLFEVSNVRLSRQIF